MAIETGITNESTRFCAMLARWLIRLQSGAKLVILAVIRPMKPKSRVVILAALNCLALGGLAYITLSDNSSFVSAVQAIILAATFGVIWWYTEETQKIREATLQQNQIMGDQLRVMQESAAFQSQKESQLAQPIFQQAGYDSSRDEANVKLKNLGALVKNLSVETIPKHEASISPSTAPTNELIRVRLEKLAGTDSDIELKLSYEDQRGQRGAKSFMWQRNKGTREVR